MNYPNKHDALKAIDRLLPYVGPAGADHLKIVSEYVGNNEPSRFFPWSGGECPVPKDTLVEVVLRDGAKLDGKASDFLWRHMKTAATADIVSYRLLDTLIFEQFLLELLAVVHRDGGHFVQKHGVGKAVEVAMQRISAERCEDPDASAWQYEAAFWQKLESVPALLRPHVQPLFSSSPQGVARRTMLGVRDRCSELIEAQIKRDPHGYEDDVTTAANVALLRAISSIRKEMQ